MKGGAYYLTLDSAEEALKETLKNSNNTATHIVKVKTDEKDIDGKEIGFRYYLNNDVNLKNFNQENVLGLDSGGRRKSRKLKKKIMKKRKRRKSNRRNCR